MNRSLLWCSAMVLLLLAGCDTPPQDVRFVPASRVLRLQPQPTTFAEFQIAERRGDSVVAAGSGSTWDMEDRLIRLEPGERLHPVTFNPSSGRIVARRLNDHHLITLYPEGLEVLTTTYPH